MSKRKMFLRMITASVLRRKSKVVIALLAIAVGATVLSGLMTVYTEIPRQMGAQFRNYGANMILTPEEGTFTVEDMNAATKVIPSASLFGVAPYRYENVRINDITVVAAATDMQGAQATSPYWRVDGEWPAKSGDIMLGKGVADDYALSVGDFITVTYTPEEAREQAASEQAETGEEIIPDNQAFFTVTGILTTGGSEEGYIYMSLEDMESLTATPTALSVTELSVQGSAEELSSYAEKISESTPNVKASVVKRVAASEATVLSRLQSLVLIVTIIVLALTMITVATTMTATVTERRKEIGLRKALGASNASIVGEFTSEGMLLGAIGGVLGSILGYGFALIVSQSVFNSGIAFNWLMVPITIVVSILVTGIACLLPIRSATDIDPALVLKGE